MASYLGVAKEQEISNQEIDAVTAIVMAVGAGKVRAQFADAGKRYRDAQQKS